MKNELDILIDELQREQDYLQSRIEDCTAEWDFKFARYFRISFVFTRDEIRVLKNFQNPHFDKMARLADTIRYQQNLINTHKDDQDFIKYFVNRIPEVEKELEILKQTKPKWRVDGDALMIALESLLAGKIKTMEIMLDEKRNGKLTLFLSDRDLKIQLTYNSEFTYHHVLEKGEFTKLKKIGFDVDLEPIEMVIKNPDYRHTHTIMEPIARLCFDVFHLYGDKKRELICKK